MTIKEKFEGIGERFRAYLKGGMVFIGVALFGAIVTTHWLLAVSNGFASVWALIFLILVVQLGIRWGSQAYLRALEGDDE